jgi:20S proteasome alpha/beta subunit
MDCLTQPSHPFNRKPHLRPEIGRYPANFRIGGPKNDPRPLKQRYSKAMTIALGVLCDGGAVLGVDLEYSQDFLSSPGQKMFWFPSTLDTNYFLLIAAAGNSDSAKTFIDLLSVELPTRFPTKKASLSELKSSIKKVLRELCGEHIDFAPASQRESLACDFIIAMRVDHSVRLFRTNRTMIVEEQRWVCLGAGLYLAHYLMDLVLVPHPSIELATQVVTHVIATAKEHIQSVGKGSDIHFLPYSGFADSLIRPEIIQIEERFAALSNALRDVIACADPGSITDERMARKFSALNNCIETLRADELERIKDRARRQALGSAVQSNPQPPKPDAIAGVTRRVW